MSLDVYLTTTQPVPVTSDPVIYYREAGQNKALTRAEWDARFPEREPITGPVDPTQVYHANITHNLIAMAKAAELYEPLWKPAEGATAAQLIDPLSAGLAKLTRSPATFRQYHPANGWGDYDGLVSFVIHYLDACLRYPDAIVSTWS